MSTIAEVISQYEHVMGRLDHVSACLNDNHMTMTAMIDDVDGVIADLNEDHNLLCELHDDQLDSFNDNERIVSEDRLAQLKFDLKTQSEFVSDLLKQLDAYSWVERES